MLHIRIERELKGREMAESMVISVHLTVTYRENHSAICLNIFSGCFPPFLRHLWFDISPYTDIAAVERSNEVWLRCTRLFLNVNRGIHNHQVTSVSVCRSASSFLFSTHGPKYSPTRTLKYSVSFSIPSSQFTLPFRCLITAEDCGIQC